MSGEEALIISIPFLLALIMQLLGTPVEVYIRNCIPKIVASMEQEPTPTIQRTPPSSSVSQTLANAQAGTAPVPPPVAQPNINALLPPGNSTAATPAESASSSLVPVSVTAPPPSLTPQTHAIVSCPKPSPIFSVSGGRHIIDEDAQEFGIQLALHVYQHLSWFSSILVACAGCLVAALKTINDMRIFPALGCVLGLGLVFYWCISGQHLTPRDMKQSGAGKRFQLCGYAVIVILWALTAATSWHTQATPPVDKTKNAVPAPPDKGH